MKKYSVYVQFVNGQEMKFETNTDVRTAKTTPINGGNFIITESQQVINVDYIKKLKVIELGK